MITEEQLQHLASRLAAPLPGARGQLVMAPRGRGVDDDAADYRDAAVLIALHHRNGQLGFPLILRGVDDFAHSGQVGLPGGRRERGEGLPQCALREAEEEIALPVAQVRMLGGMTPLPVPVSRHLVHPFVAVTEDDLVLKPDLREVQQILFMPVETLLAADTQQLGTVDIPGGTIPEVPFYALNGHRVWGATAMILSELREVLSEVFD